LVKDVKSRSFDMVPLPSPLNPFIPVGPSVS